MWLRPHSTMPQPPPPRGVDARTSATSAAHLPHIPGHGPLLPEPRPEAGTGAPSSTGASPAACSSTQFAMAFVHRFHQAWGDVGHFRHVGAPQPRTMKRQDALGRLGRLMAEITPRNRPEVWHAAMQYRSARTGFAVDLPPVTVHVFSACLAAVKYKQVGWSAALRCVALRCVALRCIEMQVEVGGGACCGAARCALASSHSVGGCGPHRVGCGCGL